MKDFKEFRLENFNSLLPLLKEVVDKYFEVHNILKKNVNMYSEKIEELKNEREALKRVCELKERFSKETNDEIQKELDNINCKISNIEDIIAEREDKIDDFECSIVQYNNYFIGISIGFLKNQGKLLERVEDVQIEYLREYFYLMFVLNTDFCYKFSRENLLSKEAVEYICKYLIENEKKDVANKKIAVLRGEETLNQKDFLELFK